MLQYARTKQAELVVGLVVAVAGAVVGGVLSLLGVYWQSQDSAQDVRRQAVEKFLDEYNAAFVEIEYFGSKRVPVPALPAVDLDMLRKEVHGVNGACDRLVLVAPELKAHAVRTRDALLNWTDAVAGAQPYGRAQQGAFVNEFTAAKADFIGESKAFLRLP